jgi:glycerate 2-kinase
MSLVALAPDKFKGTLTATQVAGHLATGLASVPRPTALDLVQIPVADGGDGTIDAAEAAGYRRIEMGVRGPAGQALTAAFAFSDGTAIIESAQAAGLSRLPGGELAPLTASSRGVGELLLVAARMRAKRIVLGLGGVASTDGGAGMIRALGARLLDAKGVDLPPGGAALARLAYLDLTKLRDLSGVEVIVASDVTNPLLGPSGAARVYAPQKGASPPDVQVLEDGLAHWADVVAGATGVDCRAEPGAGAAGGLGFAALTFLRASIQSGIELILDLLSFGSRLAGAQLVITGEGSLDAQTLHGKAPAGVARAAHELAPDVPVIAVCGTCSLSAAQLHEAGIARAYPLTDLEPDVAKCRANAGPLTEDLARAIARDWLG